MTTPACYAFNFLHLGLFEDVYIYLIPKQPQGKAGCHQAPCSLSALIGQEGQDSLPFVYHTGHYISDSAAHSFLCDTLIGIIATLDAQMLG